MRDVKKSRMIWSEGGRRSGQEAGKGVRAREAMHALGRDSEESVVYSEGKKGSPGGL